MGVVVPAFLHLAPETGFQALVLHLLAGHLVSVHCQNLGVLQVGLPGLFRDTGVLQGQAVVDLLQFALFLE